MSDFFTHLAGQVIQPSTDVIPNIPLRFAPGAAVPGSELAPEPPVLDTLLQPAPANSADRMGTGRSRPTLVEAPMIPKALAAQANPADHPKAEREHLAAVEEPGVENAVPAPAAAPHEIRPNPSAAASPAEGNELPRPPARPSHALPSARLNPPENEPAAQSAQPSPAAVPAVVSPKVRPVNAPEFPVGLPLSASPTADPAGPAAAERFSIPIVRPAGSLFPLEPLEPPPGQPSFAAPGPGFSVSKAPAVGLSQSQLEPLASPEAAEIAQPSQLKTDAKPSAAVIQEPLALASQRADSHSLTEILPLVKPAATQTIHPSPSTSPAAPISSSAGVKHASAETAVPQTKATLPAAAITPLAPDGDRPETILAAPLLDAGTSAQPQSASRAERDQRQAQPGHSPADLQPVPTPAIDPGLIETAGLTSAKAQIPPGTSAPKPELAVERPLFPLELNPKNIIRPVLGVKSLLDSAALSSRSGADGAAIPTVHLTIGRIVVRTVPPAAPAVSRPVPIRRQPAVSLHDYLNRHGGDK